MNPRAWLLIGALLGSHAWADGPTFDLKSDAVRKIVRDTAATQYRADPPMAAQPAREPYTRIVFQSPKDAARERPPEPPPAPPRPMSPLLSTIIDSLLGQEPGFAEEARESYLQLCRALDPDKPAIQRTASCP